MPAARLAGLLIELKASAVCLLKSHSSEWLFLRFLALNYVLAWGSSPNQAVTFSFHVAPRDEHVSEWASCTESPPQNATIQEFTYCDWMHLT